LSVRILFSHFAKIRLPLGCTAAHRIDAAGTRALGELGFAKLIAAGWKKTVRG
jgi:hypothetical protein